MFNVTVLGAGRVGRAIARDLAAGGEFDVTSTDISPDSLSLLDGEPRITTVRADLSKGSEVTRVIESADLVVGAVGGFMGYATLQAVLTAGKNVVDISFFDQDPFTLDRLARERGVVAIVDCGVAPGCSNLILGRMENELDETESFACYVGGLPVQRSWPFEYRAPFSPIDVIEEYTRPARFRRGGHDVTLPALTDRELLEFEGIGTVEAFNTDGLRTLLTTSRAPTMIEKTLRYPGHAERMEMLRESGFFSTEEMEVDGGRVRPMDVTARLLFSAWEFAPGEEDLTLMRVRVAGRSNGRHVEHTFEMIDRFDRATLTTSMARTTGYTCTAAVRLFARGLYREPGISPPEFLGRDPSCYDFIMGQLAERGVFFEERVVTG